MSCFSLEKYSGRRSRHTCPNCGKPHCFTLYVDEFGKPLDETVGRCDHESGCGYHYTPKEYFIDHPEDKRKENCDCSILHKSCGEIMVMDMNIDTIQFSYVSRSVSCYFDSDLIEYLYDEIGREEVNRVKADYFIGVTNSNDTIFFQIDIDGRVRTGKIMKYDRKSGHRVKDENVDSRVTWVHSIMKSKGLLPQKWTLSQCLFGEHLLRVHPEYDVNIVESEKTAIICSAFLPKFVWLATGGKSQLDDRRLSVIKRRRITLYPDSDAFADWNERAKQLRKKGYDVKVSTYIEKNATDADREAKIDIADLLLWAKRSKRRKEYHEKVTACNPVATITLDRETIETVNRCISGEPIIEVYNLIKDFGLSVRSVSKLTN